MYNWLESRAREMPEKPAVIFEGEAVTFFELHETAVEMKGRLMALDRRRIAFFIGNTLDAVYAIHGAMLAGIEVVMINTRLTGREIAAQLDDIDVDTVVATEPVVLEGYRVYTWKDIRNMAPVSGRGGSSSGSGILSIMFTSGTTGRAKAVTQSYDNHYASALGCEDRFGYTEDSMWMNINPIYHISGFSVLLRSVIRGCTMVLIEKFEEEKILRTISEYGVTHTSMVPIMLKRLMDHEIPDHRLEGILLGGAGVTSDILRRALSMGLPVYNSFGMTETCSQIVSIAPDDPKILDGTVGKPLGNIDIKIDDSSDGELLVRGGPVTGGYLNAVMEVSDGYFRTGDMGRIDEAGYLYILDRRKDLIISGGENVYPKEIEDAINTHPGVANAAAVKRKDPEWGEVPILLVEPVEGSALENADLFAHLGERLARYKLPKEIHHVDRIIMTSTGKVSRAQNQHAYNTKRSSNH
ncbi:o-succinylbenzoate--CoA ligase [Salinicoccus roseus]|uniref:o-succinylbenzoate--CoA ligase n=1 Tax=Salinicoccus roseus TaxID=45670 RepID=UPI001EF5611D|nr:o-succinylbenzoate--CoA ligase [Salinicoccus roseus]MCG7333437.1 o-succinylbenzoate--CoA ligase [Salinicoccus roseus]